MSVVPTLNDVKNSKSGGMPEGKTGLSRSWVSRLLGVRRWVNRQRPGVISAPAGNHRSQAYRFKEKRGETRLGVEPLEMRRLLSVTYDWDSDTGTLSVTSDELADSIVITADGNGPTSMARVNEQEVTLASQIHRIVIDAGGGGDMVNLSAINSEFTGLRATNSISVLAGEGADLVLGSEFNDILSGGGDNDVIYGGDGNDQLYGGDGHDQLYGQDGNDDLWGDGVLVTRRIASGSDDGWELAHNGSVDLEINSLDFGVSVEVPHIIGLRFADVNLPENARISSATVTFHASENPGTGTFSGNWYAENVQDPATFMSTSEHLSTRLESPNNFQIDGDSHDFGEWTPDQPYSVDVSPIIQNLVDEFSPNSVVLLHEFIDGGGYRSAASYEKNPALAPLLTVVYDSSVGNDLIDGGSGNDRAEGGEGDDTYLFGESANIGLNIVEEVNDGNDTLNFHQWNQANGISVDLGNAEGDIVTTPTGVNIVQSSTGYLVENVIGTNYNDVILGNIAANRLEGGLGDDRLDGRDGDDALVGGPGHDTLSGGTGNDKYVFVGFSVELDTIDESDGAGNDAGGTDILDFSAWTIADGIAVDLDNPQGDISRINHPSGDKIISSATGYLLENVIGTRYNDSITGNNSNNLLEGGLGDDMLDGRAGNDTLIGAAGYDVVFGRAGNDTYVLKDNITLFDTIDESDENGDDAGGTDTLDFSKLTHTDGISVDLANPLGEIAEINGPSKVKIVNSTTGQWLENVVGSDYDDTILGQGSNNHLQGGPGHDTLDGRAGSDRLEGLSGNDIYRFVGNATSFDTVDETDGKGNDTGGTDTLDFSGLTFPDGIAVDLDNAQGNLAQINEPLGFKIVSSTAGHLLENVIGSNFDDSIRGNHANNHLTGGLGSDTLRGLAGDDTYLFHGGVTLFDTIDETDDSGSDAGGTDTLDFSQWTHPEGIVVNLDDIQGQIAQVNLPSGVKVVSSTTGHLLENVIGTPFDDYLRGNNTNNQITGGSGSDQLAGLAGDDSYIFVGNVTLYDTIDETDGNENDAGGTDTLDFSGVTHIEGVAVDLNDIQGQIAQVNQPSGAELARTNRADLLENIIGTDYNDVLLGHNSENTIQGGLGNDTLDGRAGNDTLEGQAGHDMLIGGSDDDIYLFTGTKKLGADTIIEPIIDSGEDLLDFSELDFGTGIHLDLSLPTIQPVLEHNYVPLYLTLDTPELIENVTGTMYDDLMIGNTLSNRFAGLAGDDTYLFVGDATPVNYVEEVEAGGTDTLDFSRMNPLFSDGIIVDLSALDGTVASTKSVNALDLVVSTTAHLFENVIGTDFSDLIVGNDANNRLDGGPSSDTLAGRSGDDTYVFAGEITHYDTIDESDGNGRDAGGSDTLDFSHWNLTDGIVVNLDHPHDAIARLHRPLEAEIVRSSTGDLLENVMGTPLNDILQGNDKNNRLNGSWGHDILYGLAGDDTYVISDVVEDDGLIYQDTIHEEDSEGNDAGGTDTVDFSQLTELFFNQGIHVNLSNTASEQLAAARHIDTVAFVTSTTKHRLEGVIGTPYHDVIYGNSGNNHLEGGPGNDLFFGGLGDDTYVFAGQTKLGWDTIHELNHGGNGDTLDFSQLTTNAHYNLETEPGTTVFETRFGGVRIDLTKTDKLSSGARDTSVLRLDLTYAAREIEQVIGTQYDDMIIGNSTANVLVGNHGDDLLIGDDGNDVIYGGTFDGIHHAQAGRDIVMGEGGMDQLHDYDKWNDDFQLPQDKDYNTIVTAGGNHRIELQNYLDHPQSWNNENQIHLLHENAEKDAALVIARIPAGQYLIDDPGPGGTNAILLTSQHAGKIILGSVGKTIIRANVPPDAPFSGHLLAIGKRHQPVHDLMISGVDIRYAKKIDDRLYGVLSVHAANSIFDWMSVHGPQQPKDPGIDYGVTVTVAHPTTDTIFRGIDAKNSAGNIVGFCPCPMAWQLSGTRSESGAAVTQTEDKNITLLNSSGRFADYDGLKLEDPVANLRIIGGSYTKNGGDGIDLAGGGQVGILISDVTTSNNDLNGIDFKEVIHLAPILGNLKAINVHSTDNIVGAGIQVKESQDVIITGGIFSRNGTDGVKINQVDSVRIERVVAEGNANTGISVIRNSNDIKIFDPVANHNKRAGLDIVSSFIDTASGESGVTIEGGIFNFNGQNGIYVAKANDVTIREAVVQDNTAQRGSFPGAGILVYASHDITIERTISSGNERYNLDVHDAWQDDSERVHIIDSFFSDSRYHPKQDVLLSATTQQNIRFEDTSTEANHSLARYKLHYAEGVKRDEIPLDASGQSQPALDLFQYEFAALDDFFKGVKNTSEFLNELFAKPPQVVSFSRDGGGQTFQSVKTLEFTFSESMDIAANAFSLYNNSPDSSEIELHGVVFDYDSSRFTARWDLRGTPKLTPGSYSLVLQGSSLARETGLPLDGNGDGIGGDNYTETLVVALAGDTDLNLNVDIADFNNLTTNYDSRGSRIGNDWSKGNFDKDGDIDFTDSKALLVNFSPGGYASLPESPSQSVNNLPMATSGPFPLIFSSVNSLETLSTSPQESQAAVDLSFAMLGKMPAKHQLKFDPPSVANTSFFASPGTEKLKRWRSEEPEWTQGESGRVPATEE